MNRIGKTHNKCNIKTVKSMLMKVKERINVKSIIKGDMYNQKYGV